MTNPASWPNFFLKYLCNLGYASNDLTPSSSMRQNPFPYGFIITLLKLENDELICYKYVVSCGRYCSGCKVMIRVCRLSAK